MKLDDFDYHLPPERIAQRPAARRDHARLMVLDRASGERHHSRFDRLTDWLDAGDLMVFNDTKVIPARLSGMKQTGGRVELLLTERLAARAPDEQDWGCLVRGSVAVGAALELAPGFTATVTAKGAAGEHRVRLGSEQGAVDQMIDRHGVLPLPPYIKRRADTGGGDAIAAADRIRYQTVFARHPGAVAAPTAGLHFAPRTLCEIEDSGIERAFLTLHIGPGTFAPVRSEQVEDHVMHAERFELGTEVVEKVARVRERGGRVVAVGTTVARTLEWCAAAGGRLTAGRGVCDLFIVPGYRFRVVDALVTNFHLPRSTLLMLVSAFAGREHVLEAYESAVRRDYRFYSYGDGMLMRSTA